MNIDSYSIFLKNLIKISDITIYFLKNNCFLNKNVPLLLDLLYCFCYNNIINNKLYILMFFNFLLKNILTF